MPEPEKHCPQTKSDAERGLAPSPGAAAGPVGTVTVFDLLTGESCTLNVIADSPAFQGASLPRPRLPQSTPQDGRV
ncbi:MAG TPA: hypothetical protein VN521_10310 [Negativicutes bacterium]|nr:hypothetical protein [Negativicutes bacterium]